LYKLIHQTNFLDQNNTQIPYLYFAFTYSTFTFPSETDRSSSTGPGKLSAQKFFRRGIGLIPSLANLSSRPAVL